MKYWDMNWITKYNPLVSSNDLISKLLRLKQSQNDTNSIHNDSELNIESDQLDDHEIRMIKGVFRLDRTIVREIMIPRVDIVSSSINVKLKKISELMFSSGHSKIPVYDDEIDRIKGIAYARDVLGLLLKDPSSINKQIGTNLLRPALFVPETKILDNLLTQFQQEQVHIAIVMDEYGGVSGIVTIEDLLEEIVGEIVDEIDSPSNEFYINNRGVVITNGENNLKDLYKHFDLNPPESESSTIAGYIMEITKKIPLYGEITKDDFFSYKILSHSRKQISTVEISRINL